MQSLQTYAQGLIFLVLGSSVIQVRTTNEAKPHIDFLVPQNLSNDLGKVDADSDIAFLPLKPPESNYKAGSEEPSLGAAAAFYDFSIGFVESSMSGGFPYELAVAASDGKTQDFDWQGNTRDYVNYGVALAVGIIFILVIPIAGCCFCCCRCCGRCGGRRVIKKAEDAGYGNPCGRRTALFLLLVPLVFAIAGTALMFQANESVSTSIQDFKDPGLNKLDDVSTFLKNFVKQAEPAILGKYNLTVDVLERDLENIGYLLGQPVKSMVLTESGLAKIYDQIIAIDKDGQNLLSHLKRQKDYKKDFVTESDTVKKEFDTSSFKTNLKNAISSISSFDVGKKYLAEMDAVDPEQLPDLDVAEATLQTILQSDVQSMVEKSRKALDDVPEKIQNETETTRKDILSELSDYSRDIQDVIKNIQQLRDDVLDNINFDEFKNESQDGLDTVITYDKHRWYAGLALAILSLLVELFLLLSIVMGVFGGDAYDLPEDRGSLSNCAGSLLLAGCVLTFIISWFLMFLTMLLFVISAPLNTVVCGPVKDLTIVDKLLNDYEIVDGKDGNGTWLGNQIFADQGVDLRLAQLLSDCGEGKTLYTALQLNQTNLVDLNELTNFQKSFDIDGELKKLNVDFSGTSLDNSELNDFLSKMSGIENTLNYNALKMVLEKNQASLTTKFLEDLQPYIDGLTNNKEKSDIELLQKEALEFDKKNEQLRIHVNNINENLDEMKAITTPTNSDSLADRCNKLTISLNDMNSTRISQIIRDAFTKGITDYTKRITKIFNQFVEALTKTITKEMGVCEPLYNIYDDLFVNGACTYALGSVIAFMCAMGMTSVFLLLTTCFSCNASKHLYRMHYAEDDDVHPSAPPMEHTLGQNSFSQVFNNKVYHSESTN
ncbi:prominin-1 [Plakobranchus ocellatus]|uniref:Prominin-1 n=1 Tax=Plakobranchus ocellatus TaxID=259542 RepID=A0AAV4B6F4_9GAST|nr:prominin-1 [Plakobranchus ocellatus]